MLLVMLGGALGTWLRYVVARWFDEQDWSRGFPFGTLFINVTGSFILAVAATIIWKRLGPEYGDWYLLIGTGFCGGYTTFSTFEWETFQLVRDHSYVRAFFNVGGSVGAGFAGVLLGVALVELLFPKS